MAILCNYLIDSFYHLMFRCINHFVEFINCGVQFRNKRIMAGSPFDPQRAEPSQQQPNATPPLDPQRAELSRRHVKALNIQFARSCL